MTAFRATAVTAEVEIVSGVTAEARLATPGRR